MCPVAESESESGELDTFPPDCPALAFVFVEIQIQISLVQPSTDTFSVEIIMFPVPGVM